jgi:hypothetical protein
MELVRTLPASDAAPALARSAVDLAVGHDVLPETADQVQDLTSELLAESSPGVETETIELRVQADAESVRVEVAWTGEPRASNHHPSDGPHTAVIGRLSDRWGTSTDGAHHRLWAERSADPSSATP